MDTIPQQIITHYEVSVNGLLYTYSIKPVDITNALGAVMGTLTEYNLSGSAGDNILLYRTKEGNWYDMKQSGSAFKNAISIEEGLALMLQYIERRGVPPPTPCPSRIEIRDRLPAKWLENLLRASQ